MALRFYTFLYYLVLPLVLLRLIYRGVKAPGYRQRIAERFGIFKAPASPGAIWVHAVSVGETIAAVPVVRQILERYPERTVVMTTMTPTGSDRVRALLGDSVFHVYAPYDLPVAVNAFLRKIKPSLLVIMETELWPNMIHACRRNLVPVLVANARLSAKSASGYQKVSALTAPMLSNVTKIVAQTQADADRFKGLGMASERVVVSGSIKFDIDLDEKLCEQAAVLKKSWGDGRTIWVAASTHAGEDEILLQAHKTLLKHYPQLLLVLVPRHPERFEAVAALVQQQGLCFQCRSNCDVPDDETQVVVGDTMGELLLLYGVSDIAFVGGSLVDSGGHNMLEPAAWGLPILTGPSDFNFAAISAMLQAQGALKKVTDSTTMVEQIHRWLESKTDREIAGNAAAGVVKENRGALARLVEEIDQLL